MAASVVEFALDLLEKPVPPVPHQRIPEEVADFITQKAAIDILLDQGRESTFTANGKVKPKNDKLLSSTIKDGDGNTLLNVDAYHIYDSSLFGVNGPEHVEAKITDAAHNLVATVDSEIFRDPGSPKAIIATTETDSKNHSIALTTAWTDWNGSVQTVTQKAHGGIIGDGKIGPVTGRTATEANREITITDNDLNRGTEICTTASQYWDFQEQLGLRPLQNTDTTCHFSPDPKTAKD